MDSGLWRSVHKRQRWLCF
uniref:Uncharacterized protein n=1 Tax=Arundo donax TaxID=35708 RepID=A0A0A9EVP9_ARUDO